MTALVKIKRNPDGSHTFLNDAGEPLAALPLFHIAVKKPLPVWVAQMPTDFEVETTHGVVRAKAGDWLMRGPKGELYPCDAETFKETYDLL